MLVWYVVGSWIAQWRNDIMVWENKKVKSADDKLQLDFPQMRCSLSVVC